MELAFVKEIGAGNTGEETFENTNWNGGRGNCIGIAPGVPKVRFRGLHRVLEIFECCKWFTVACAWGSGVDSEAGRLPTEFPDAQVG